MPSCLTRRAGLYLSIAFAALLVAGCSGDDPAGPSDQQAPALPSASTMTIDLSFFQGVTANSRPAEQGKSGRPTLTEAAGKENFINAALRVAFIHRMFCEALKAPVSAFALAIHSVPQRQPDASWLWTYIYVENEIEYGIYLFGTNAGDRTEWRMEVSTNNPQMPLDHFVWFDGEALKYESRGYWQFYEPVLGPPAVPASTVLQTPGKQSIRMDWLNLTGNVHQLNVMNNDPDSPDTGDELVVYSSPVESYITFTDASDPAVVYQIAWCPDGSGSIQVPDYPVDNPGQKACWDTNQFDVACPQ